MKVLSLTTWLIQLNIHLPYFPPDCPDQHDDIKEILYYTMRNMQTMKMVEQRYNYLDGPIHSGRIL